MCEQASSLFKDLAVVDHNVPKGWALVVSDGFVVDVITPQDIARWERNEQPGCETTA